VAQVIRMVVFFALMCVMLVGATACGAETALPSSSTTTSVATADAAAAEAIQAMSDYADALKAWARSYELAFEKEAAEALEFVDPTRPTASEVERAREFASSVRASLADLKAIDPPNEIARAHSQLCSAMYTEMNALDRFISALDWGSERDAELAYREAEEAYALWLQAVKGLDPYVDLSDVNQN
jgi:hypothetical protein